MASTTVREFDSRLAKLFEYRTHWLKSLIREKQRGPAPSFNKRRVDKTIHTLQDLAVETLLHSRLLPPLTELFDQKRQWHPRRGKGRGVSAKQKAFKTWYDGKLSYKNCVYVFWNGRKCLYVGRTLNGKGRPSSQFSKFWFGKATRLDIFCSKAKRSIPALECRLTHQYEPSYSRIKPSRSPRYRRCDICEVEDAIYDEIKDIFALR